MKSVVKLYYLYKCNETLFLDEALFYIYSNGNKSKDDEMKAKK